MPTLRSFLRIVDLHTVVVSALALAATAACIRWDLRADLPTALIGIAVIFPIVFSIHSAYRRREEALGAFASLRAHAAALAWAHRDWPGEADGHGERGRDLLLRLIRAIADLLATRRGDEGASDPAVVYGLLSELSRSHETLRSAGVSSGEVSRANQYLRHVVLDFERMRTIRDYRTPRALRAYSRIFLNAFPVLYAPYFAYLAAESSAAIGYTVAFVYSLVLVSLDNVQDALENPFDAIGEDDVDLAVAPELERLLTPSH